MRVRTMWSGFETCGQGTYRVFCVVKTELEHGLGTQINKTGQDRSGSKDEHEFTGTSGRAHKVGIGKKAQGKYAPSGTPARPAIDFLGTMPLSGLGDQRQPCHPTSVPRPR